MILKEYSLNGRPKSNNNRSDGSDSYRSLVIGRVKGV